MAKKKITLEVDDVKGGMLQKAHVEAMNLVLDGDGYKNVINAVFHELGANVPKPELSPTEQAIYLMVSKDVFAAVQNYVNGKKGGRPKKTVEATEDDSESDCENPGSENQKKGVFTPVSENAKGRLDNKRKENKRQINKREENTTQENKRARANAQAHLDQLGKLYPLGVNWSQVSANAKRELLNVSPAQMKCCVDNYERWREAQTTRDFSPRYKAATTWFERAWKDFVEYKPPANANTGGKRSQRYVSAEGPRDFSYAEAVSEVPPEIWKTLTDEQRKAWIDNYHGQAWTGEASPPYAVAN